MRVLYVVKNMRLSNGVASYAMNYFRQLNGEELKIDFLVISDVGSPFYDEIEDGGSKIYLMPSYKTKPLSIIPYLRQIFKANKYDILHCNVVNSGSLILMIAKQCEIPVRIIHCHATKTGDKKWKEIRNQFFRNITLRCANYYLACSKLAGEYLFGNRKYHLVPNAINIPYYSYNEEQRSSIRTKLNCGDKFIIMTVGRFTIQKNPFFILKIIENLVKEKAEFEFWWFGNGELEAKVKEEASKRGIEQNIVFWGASDKVNEYYSAADVFILPSIYEGLPVVGIEAQVAGLPTLFSDKVTKETKISNAVEFLSIDDCKAWTERIMSYKYFSRSDNVKSLDLRDYDIETQSNTLRLLYEKLVEREKK